MIVNESRNSEEDLLRGLTVRIENHGIPVQKGLGGSAALCVSVAAAMLQCRHPSDCTRSFLEEVNAWAYKGEVLYHGKPSGIDNTVSCYGIPVRLLFRRWSRGVLQEK